MISATGVTVKSYGSGTANYILRGFELDSVAIDGIRTTGSSSGTHGHGSPDLTSYERIEVLRGAASRQQGAGEPGAD
ncbi:MAG TPA: TonB-dependent siderophore receptor, partial [Gammaproteobacteria bacterium]|nr:TonB-dependent siderophore receptor [Gammaproteobacteria bacterium]